MKGYRLQLGLAMTAAITCAVYVWPTGRAENVMGRAENLVPVSWLLTGRAESATGRAAKCRPVLCGLVDSTAVIGIIYLSP